jgi:drug/metabolite transporter (DMT)-like permease
MVYFAYTYAFNNHLIKRAYTNCCDLTFTQISSLVFLSVVTVVSSLLVLYFDKYFNTPFVNNILLKGFSIIVLFLVGIFIFEEGYHVSHLLGIGMTIAGIMILLYNPVAST